MPGGLINIGLLRLVHLAVPERHGPRGAPAAWGLGGCGQQNWRILQDFAIFGGLVLGCFKTKFCKKICVWQHFSSSKRFASFCTAAISKFSQKIGLKNQQFSWNFSKKIANVAKFAKFCQISKISAWESGRFWKMLQNAYFLAKIGADTAENEQHFFSTFCQDFDKIWIILAS